MSARISGVKNVVSIGDSLVRALPVSHVKSANAKGSAAGDFGTPALPFSVAWGLTAARTFSAGMTFVIAPVPVGASLAAATAAEAIGSSELGCGEGAAAAAAAGELFLLSSSATRFSSCSMRSSIQRSRSVKGAGASTLEASLFGGADFGRGLLDSLSSACRQFEKMPTDSNAVRKIRDSLPLWLNARISLS